MVKIYHNLLKITIGCEIMTFKRWIVEGKDGILNIFTMGALRVQLIGQYKPKSNEEKI